MGGIMKAQVIYYSRYGSTREIAQSLGNKLGTDNICEVRDLKKITGDLAIIGSPIYVEVPHEEIMRLLFDEEGRLKDKPVALFLVCLRKNLVKVGDKEGGGPLYLRRMEEALGKLPVASKIFGGRMIASELGEEDRKRTETFSKKVGMPFKDVDIMSEKEVDEFVQDIKTKMMV